MLRSTATWWKGLDILHNDGFQETGNPGKTLMLLTGEPLADLLLQPACIHYHLIPAEFFLLHVIFLNLDLSVLMLYTGLTLAAHAVTVITCSNRHLSL